MDASGPTTLPAPVDAGATDPPLDYPAYRSTARRAPIQPPVPLPGPARPMHVPMFGEGTVGAFDHDLTAQTDRSPIGERIVVAGRVLDRDARPLSGALVEIWQANAAGRYAHQVDDHDAPLDPGFVGAGRTLTDTDGGYRFLTIRPGAYPWANHHNAWRPAHIHFSVFGRDFLERLVTQMYFPGDPLLAHDPIFQSVPGPGRPLLVAGFDLSLAEAGHHLGYRWDIVVAGRSATPTEPSG